jgi:hypothetical protein
VTSSTNGKYPEHEKLEATSTDDREAIGSFLEWLESKGYQICKWRNEGNNGRPRRLHVKQAELEKIREDSGFFAYIDAKEHGLHNPEFEAWGAGFHIDGEHRGIEEWLADYFEIDQKKLSAEKDQIYREMVEQQKATLVEKTTGE